MTAVLAGFIIIGVALPVLLLRVSGDRGCGFPEACPWLSQAFDFFEYPEFRKTKPGVQIKSLVAQNDHPYACEQHNNDQQASRPG
ncbi:MULTISPECIES: hypothetical protein [unclassified Burkholderia]|uniref:hypothetical protein n=1 Tax=unclassified Burkholderia TaxID=2613784 RepID=UPI002AB28F86|nr:MULTISPECIES: hypothetical protein [unclassified Burkholderia]